MAWFDILANVGSAAEQSTANFQRLLLQQRELQERQRQQEEERRRWEASERRATLADQRAAEEAARAAAAEGRATRQFELGLKREAEQRVEQELRQYGADPIPQEVVDALALKAPGAVKSMLRKNQQTGEWRLRMGPEEELKATQARRATQLLSIPEADIAKQPMAARKELGRLRGDENMYLTPKEVEAEVRRSPGFMISQMQMQAYANRMNAVTPADMQRANYQYSQDYNATERLMRGEDRELMAALDAALDADPAFGDGVKGQGRAAFNRQRQKNAPLAEAKYLELANEVRQRYNLPPAAMWNAPLQQERPAYDPPFPDLPSAGSARGLRATPSGVRGQTMRTPSGRTVVQFTAP